MPNRHEDQTEIHQVHRWEHADATARNAQSVTTDDLGKISWQQDDDSIWMLVGTGPTWVTFGTVASTTGEIFLAANEGWPRTSNGCAAVATEEYPTNDVNMRYMAFDQTTQEFAQWTEWMPDDWDGGTITAKFFWSALVGSGGVTWGLQGQSYADDTDIDTAWGTAQEVTDTLTALDGIHITTVTAAITLGGGPVAGEPVQFQVYRDPADGGDTLTGDAILFGVKVYFTRT